MLTKKYSPKHSALASLRFEAKCFNCLMDNTLYLELDHVVAKANGGENKDFLLLCSRCNKAKGKQTVEKFFADSEVLAELNYRLSLTFTEDEIMTELSRLVYIELTYASNTKAKAQKLSTSAQRASQMRGVR